MQLEQAVTEYYQKKHIIELKLSESFLIIQLKIQYNHAYSLLSTISLQSSHDKAIAIYLIIVLTGCLSMRDCIERYIIYHLHSTTVSLL